MRAIGRMKTLFKDWLGRAIILAVGLVPASCHYEITGPLLWAHQSSYAFEAWLVMWIISLAIAAGVIYVAVVKP